MQNELYKLLEWLSAMDDHTDLCFETSIRIIACKNELFWKNINNLKFFKTLLYFSCYSFKFVFNDEISHLNKHNLQFTLS